MSNVYFTSLSGMMAASFGLKSVSHNVSNMQTPGYKGESAFYSAVGSSRSRYECLGGYGQSGNGVTVSGNTTNFEQGKLIQGSSKSQLAINGEGMFIIQLENNNLLYTRDGEFHFNQDDFLVDDHSGGFVMGYGANGQLVKISKAGPPSYPGKASEEINLSGELYYEEITEKPESESTNKDPKFKDGEISNITVYDARGKAHDLTLTFKFSGMQTKLAPDKITLIKVSENGNTLFENDSDLLYSIEYSAGNPMDFQHAITLSLQFEGCSKQSVKLNFKHNTTQVVRLLQGDPIQSDNKVKVADQDGYAIGHLFDYEFDQEGKLHYLYTNDKKNEGIHVALARFDDPQRDLIASGESTFSARTGQGIHIGTGHSKLFGKVFSQNLESSNIDSTREFANIVVLQRMFQACSQIMDIEKQLLDDMAKK